VRRVSEPAIFARGLRKSYGDVEALRGIDLQVDHGEVFALLGPNGAGKTTTTEILEGYREPTDGEVRVLDHDPSKHELSLRQQIGIVLQSTGVDPFLTVAETVEMFRGYYPHPRPRDEVIELVGLRDKGRTRVNKLSGGQQRRLDVAVGLAGDPTLLFLDEPTTGFDPSARRNAWQMIGNLAAIGKTVFLTTHFMDEAEHLANRVAVIVDGEIVAEGAPSALGGRNTAVTVIGFRVPDGVNDAPQLGQTRLADGSFEARVDEPEKALHELTGWALDHGIQLQGLDVSRPTLEDVYLELTGGGDGSTE
jgi:ABC-2 type transport system ATP-binding protein